MNALEKVMDEFNEAYTSAKTEKQRDAVNKKFESKIDKAEQALEKEFEEQIKKDNADLEAEQKADAKALIDLEKDAPLTIKEKYTIKKLKKLAKENRLKGYSKLKEDGLIKLLQSNGVTL